MIRNEGDDKDVPPQSVFEATLFKDLGPCKFKWSIHWPVQSEDGRAITEKTQRPFQFRTGLLLQVMFPAFIGSFQVPQSAPLILNGNFHGKSLSFETDKPWPCSTILAETFDGMSSDDGLSLKRAAIALHPLDKQTWVLAVYHVLDVGDSKVIKSVFIHRRRTQDVTFSEQQSSVSVRSTEQQSCAETVTDEPRTGLKHTILDIEEELARAQEALVEAIEELDEIKGDHEFCDHELVTLELDSLGLQTNLRLSRDQAPAPDDADEAICLKYREYLELGDRFSDQEFEVAELEDRVWELEDLLENGVREWQEVRVREADRIVAETIDIGTLPSVDLSEYAYVADYSVSEAVLTMLRTVVVLRTKLVPAQVEIQERLDYSPLIGQMAKTCERLFGDAFSSRRSLLSASNEANLLLNNGKQFEVEIPAEDKEHKIDKSSLCKVLSMIEKRSSDEWSGTRNCAIALLLFGRHHRTIGGSCVEIRNPLGVTGTETERTQLRVALYRLQKERNGFVHHDVASLDDAKYFESLFIECVRGLVQLLYSRK